MPYPNGCLPNIGELVTLDGYPDDPGPWRVHETRRDHYGSWWVRVIRDECRWPPSDHDVRDALVSMTTPAP